MSSREKMGTHGIIYYRRELNVNINFYGICSLWVVGQTQLIPDPIARDFFPIRGYFFLDLAVK